MIALIPADFRSPKRAFREFVKEMIANDEKEFFLVFVFDDALLKLSVEMALEKGWLGDSAVREVSQVLKSQFREAMDRITRVLENLLEREIGRDRELKYSTVVLEGNFRKILSEFVGEKKICKLFFTYKKGYNPYWKVLKPVVQALCEELSMKLPRIECLIVGG